MCSQVGLAPTETAKFGKIVFDQLKLASNSPTPSDPLQGGQREFVGDAGIVDRQCGGEDAVAADGMGVGGGSPQGHERAWKGAGGHAGFGGWHRGFSSLKECERAPEGARGG